MSKFVPKHTVHLYEFFCNQAGLNFMLCAADSLSSPDSYRYAILMVYFEFMALRIYFSTVGPLKKWSLLTLNRRSNK